MIFTDSIKERPLLMSGPMVRAILSGTKTQTRRIVKPQSAILTDEMARSLGVQPPLNENPAVVPCPYGRPGDRLWVRETWAVQHQFDAMRPSEIGLNARWHYAATEDLGGLRKRQSIFMPRRGSRILLEITDVRVERLQEISKEDARAEGIDVKGYCTQGRGIAGREHQIHFRRLWKSIYGICSWHANPWVWVITFQRLQ